MFGIPMVDIVEYLVSLVAVLLSLFGLDSEKIINEAMSYVDIFLGSSDAE